MIAISLAGLDRSGDRPWSGGLREALAWAEGLGFRAVTLDGTSPGLRARELDRSARRDIAALLRRRELTLAGLDLWIPPEHFADDARADHAMAATLGAIELMGDLVSLAGGGGRGVVSVALPDWPERALVDLVRTRADACGVRVADHALATGSAPEGVEVRASDPVGVTKARLGVDGSPGDPLGVGLDPPAALLAGFEPGTLVSSLGGMLRSARLANLASTGRVALHDPSGRLDELKYLVALTTAGYEDHMIVDLRGVSDQHGAAADAARRLLPHTPSPAHGS